MIESLFLPLIAAAALGSSQPAPPQPDEGQPADRAEPELTEENRAALRCSAAFAIVTSREGGEGGDGAELRERGREFFVVTLAGLMDEHDLDRAAIEREVRGEAQELNRSGEADAIMPACLLMLRAAGI
jgi:hypothetical protein